MYIIVMKIWCSDKVLGRILLIGVWGWSGMQVWGGTVSPTGVVAVVGGVPLLSSQVEERCRFMALNVTLSPDMKAMVRRQALHMMVAEETQRQTLKALEGVVYSDKARQRALKHGWERLAQTHRTTVAAFKALLKENNVSLTQVEALLSHEDQWSRYIMEKFRSRAIPGPKEISTYQRNQSQATLHVWELRRNVTQATEEQKVFQHVSKILTLIQQGMALFQAALHFSEGYDQHRGGDRGWVQSQDITPKFVRDTLEKAQPKTLVGPLWNGQGWSIYVVLDKKSQGDRLKAQEIKAYLFRQNIYHFDAQEKALALRRIWQKIYDKALQ